MTTTFTEISGSCCNPCGSYELQGCAAGVPYVQIVAIGSGTATTRWVNLETGAIVDVKPAGFVTGDCASASNSQTCYTFGADAYSVFDVSGTKTYFKNDVLLTAQADIDAALALIATATYENLVACGGEVVPAETCKAAHYEQLTLVPGTAQTITHEFAMTNFLAIGYSVRGVDGATVGDWPTGVRFINHTADTVDVIADGIGGVVDIVLTNTECLASVVTDGSATGGGGGTDSQTLSLTGNTLAISNGNSVDLGTLIPEGCCVPDGGLPGQVLIINPDGSTGWVTPSGGGTDSQTLTLTGTTLAISNGNSVSLAAAIKAGETLTVLGTPTWNSVTGVLSIPYTDEAGTLNTKTVVVNPTFVVGNAQDLVGDTTGTVRNTITEVIVGGNTTYTIKSDLPLATSTPNGCPNGLVYDAARGGWYVEDCPEGTPTGNGKVGDIWSQPWNTTIGTELVVGDYKFRANPSTTLNHTQVTAVTGTFEIQAQGQHQTNSGPTAYVVGASTVTAGTWKDFSITANASLNGAGDRNVMIDRTNDRAYEIVYQRTTPAGGAIVTTTGQIIVTRLR